MALFSVRRRALKVVSENLPLMPLPAALVRGYLKARGHGLGATKASEVSMWAPGGCPPLGTAASNLSRGFVHTTSGGASGARHTSAAAVIALGSNQGDRVDLFRRALRALGAAGVQGKENVLENFAWPKIFFFNLKPQHSLKISTLTQWRGATTTTIT